MRDRDEHLSWSRDRAREYLDAGDHQNAVTSMLSDLGKHPAWQGSRLLDTMAMLYMIEPTTENARRIIEGFN
jgi:hypothetical protein